MENYNFKKLCWRLQKSFVHISHFIKLKVKMYLFSQTCVCLYKASLVLNHLFLVRFGVLSHVLIASLLLLCPLLFVYRFHNLSIVLTAVHFNICFLYFRSFSPLFVTSWRARRCPLNKKKLKKMMKKKFEKLSVHNKFQPNWFSRLASYRQHKYIGMFYRFNRKPSRLNFFHSFSPLG